MRRRCRKGWSWLLRGREDTCPHASPLGTLANRPDLRAGGAQDSKHTAKLFDIVLPRKERGSVQQFPQDAAHSPVDTDPKSSEISHQDTHLPPPALLPHTRTQVSPHHLCHSHWDPDLPNPSSIPSHYRQRSPATSSITSR